MPRGAKPGERRGGRQKGTKNKATLERETATAAVVAEAKAKGVQPLEVLLGSMRQAWAQGDCKQASFYAEKAAPYVHPRLASTDMTMKDDRTVDELSIDEITRELRARGIFPEKGSASNGANGSTEDMH